MDSHEQLARAQTQGHCPHGEFNLQEGCPQCIADRQAEEGNTKESIAEAVKKANRNIVKVQYYSETTGELSDREYTYFSADRLSVGNVVTVPVRDTTGKAKVSAVGVSAAEIINFKDKVKTIPSGSIIVTDELAPDDEVLVEIDGGGNIVPKAVATETAIALRPGEDIEVRSYHTEALKLLEYAELRKIATVEDVKVATDDLSVISKLKKSMEEKRKEYLEPLKAQTEAIRDTYNYLMAPVLEADKITCDKMLAYDAEQKRKARAAEEINRKRMEASQEEMKLKGELSEPVNLVETPPEAPKSTKTDLGTASVTDCWKYEVVDFAQLPDEYKVADTAMLNSIAKKHHDQKQILGVRFYNEPIIAVRAR